MGAKRCIVVRFGTSLQDSERAVARFSHKKARKWHRTQLSMRNSDSAAFFGPENSFYRQNWSSFAHFMAVFRNSVGLIRAFFSACCSKSGQKNRKTAPFLTVKAAFLTKGHR